MTSYQRLKNKVEKLKKDIFILATEPDSMEAMRLKTYYKYISSTSKAMWFGTLMFNDRIGMNPLTYMMIDQGAIAPIYLNMGYFKKHKGFDKFI